MMALKLGVTALASRAKRHMFSTSTIISEMGMRKEAFRYMGYRNCGGGDGNNLREKPIPNPEKFGEVIVYWDAEDCGVAVPPSFLQIFRSIYKYLLRRGMRDERITFFNGYGNTNLPQLKHVLEAIDFHTSDKMAVFSGILTGMCSSIRHNPPPRVILISANRDFSGVLRKLEERCYPIVVAHFDNDNKGELFEWPEMCSLNKKNSNRNTCRFEDQTQVALPAEAKPRVLGVFWDLETCNVPKGVPCDAISVSIKTFLSRHGINEEINTFNVYGDVSTVPQAFVEGCNKKGMSIIDLKKEEEDSVLRAILVDMSMFSIDYPCHSTILLISGKPYLDFSSVLNSLQSHSTMILLAVPNLKTASHILIRDYGEFAWEWPQMATTGYEQVSRRGS